MDIQEEIDKVFRDLDTITMERRYLNSFVMWYWRRTEKIKC